MKNARIEAIELYQCISDPKVKNTFRVISMIVEFTPGRYRWGEKT